MDYNQLSEIHKVPQLSGRYITLNRIVPLIENARDIVTSDIVAHSVKGKPIFRMLAGTGKVKVLMWSQMHGNESTTTKALFDFIDFLSKGDNKAQALLERFTFCLIPMLNPDGAEAYTRENANGIDLNRDFCDLSQPESNALLAVANSFQPDYCYNLHDQRTIFGAGDSGLPATVSFLAPAYNDAREINPSRARAIEVISAMNTQLQMYIPGQVGRFDDSYNINCAGDTFQARNIPTILFEAGHYPFDYEREMSRKYIFIAILSGLKYISENVIVGSEIQKYLNISQNKTNFYDFVYKNVSINYDSNKIITNFAAQYIEVLRDDKIIFEAKFTETGDLDGKFGHQEYNGYGESFAGESGAFPIVGDNADFFIGHRKFCNGSEVPA